MLHKAAFQKPSLSRASVIITELLYLVDKTRQRCTDSSYTGIWSQLLEITIPVYLHHIHLHEHKFMEIHWISSLLSASECIWWLLMHVGRSPVPVKILMAITVIKSFFQFQHDFILFSKISDTIDNGNLFLYIL